MRLFLDTNVLASALMGHGLCRDLLDRIVIDHVVILGKPVHDELRRILVEKFRVPARLWRTLEDRLSASEQAPPADWVLNIDIPDPDDIPVLACAVTARADLVVTGDKALLELRFVEGIPMLSPRHAWLKLITL